MSARDRPCPHYFQDPDGFCYDHCPRCGVSWREHLANLKPTRKGVDVK